MSNYQTKGIVNRYWKRPKPRVYECNVRDAERFYNQSYKDYLEAKESSARKRDGLSSYMDDSSPSWKVIRSNSLLDPANDSGYNSSSRSGYLNSSYSSRNYGEDSGSRGPMFRASSLTNTRGRSTENDISFDDRIQRVQKLRQELGLPSGSSGGGGSKVSFDLPSETTLNITSKRISSPAVQDRRGRALDTSEGSSYSSSFTTSRSRASDLTSDSFGDKNSGGERSSRFSSKYATANGDSYSLGDSKLKSNAGSSYSSKDDSDKYSFKSSARSNRRYDLEDDSFSSKPTTSSESTKSFKSSRKVAAEIDDADDCDADAFLSNIKKKFPTSDEILERIKKMDSEI